MNQLARPRLPGSRGFTLVEMVIAIALIGLIAVAAAPLMKLPMVAWMDASRRATLTTQLHSTRSLVQQDMQRALPGSARVRVIGSRVLLEVLEVRATGRYRNGPSGGATACPTTCSAPGRNDVLEPGCNDSCFTTLGGLVGDAPVTPADWLVLSPLGAGVPGGDPYFGGNVRVNGGIKSRLQNVAAAPDGQRLLFTAHSFPNASAARRFYVVSGPITYDCNPATQTLSRLSGYAIAAAQPAAFGAALSATVATGVVACSIEVAQGQVQFNLRLAANAANSGVPEAVQWAASFALRERP